MKKFFGGFTLLEILISVAIFSVVMLVAIGSLLSIVEANRRARAVKSVVTNLDSALENMTRGIRVGGNYRCGGNEFAPDCPQTPASSITFTSSKGTDVTYRLNPNPSFPTIQKNEGSGFVNITDPAIAIDTLEFYVDGAPKNDAKQPKVLMLVSGIVNAGTSEQSSFHIETLISERTLDI